MSNIKENLLSFHFWVLRGFSIHILKSTRLLSLHTLRNRVLRYFDIRICLTEHTNSLPKGEGVRQESGRRVRYLAILVFSLSKSLTVDGSALIWTTFESI